jgi:hypothetical protein
MVQSDSRKSLLQYFSLTIFIQRRMLAVAFNERMLCTQYKHISEQSAYRQAGSPLSASRGGTAEYASPEACVIVASGS